jgi:hypothetical protein
MDGSKLVRLTAIAQPEDSGARSNIDGDRGTLVLRQCLADVGSHLNHLSIGPRSARHGMIKTG